MFASGAMNAMLPVAARQTSPTGGYFTACLLHILREKLAGRRVRRLNINDETDENHIAANHAGLYFGEAERDHQVAGRSHLLAIRQPASRSVSTLKKGNNANCVVISTSNPSMQGAPDNLEIQLAQFGQTRRAYAYPGVLVRWAVRLRAAFWMDVYSRG